jgi:hypothetical protein
MSQVCHAEVQKSGVDEKGHGLFATRDLAAGDRIYTASRPLLAAVERDKLDSTCSNCYWAENVNEVGKKALACSQCKQLYFCSKVGNLREAGLIYFSCSTSLLRAEMPSRDLEEIS